MLSARALTTMISVHQELYPLRAEVESANQTRMKLLRTDAEIYTAFDGQSTRAELFGHRSDAVFPAPGTSTLCTSGGSVQEPHREKLLSNTMAQRVIVLKIDAQVMLTKNVDETRQIFSSEHPPPRADV